ncbi:MAG: hypothetical protein MJZ52_04725 [Bacteroidales bacterium]|nr:hypothetical protein [Bacteroidales bacterium]MCQ2270513.1 hypothetical protein [Bacteroidales bacterium]
MLRFRCSLLTSETSEWRHTLVGLMAAAQNKSLMYVWDAAATSCPNTRLHSGEA